MLGSQRSEAMTPDARYQVDADGTPADADSGAAALLALEFRLAL
jgi:hypothetical protein